MSALGIGSKAGQFFTEDEFYLKIKQESPTNPRANEFDLEIRWGKFDIEDERLSYLRKRNWFYTKLDNIRNLSSKFAAELEGNKLYKAARIREKPWMFRLPFEVYGAAVITEKNCMK